eukprot:CAMPEP_0201516126 /NCGR_PEP_ID=MMETSP0161_2-20130828/7525_1 /ASSEMBLY_ACC=CAM_ASM_000251 /TAXON_ID=180227 /ORGANISM="Neoparamoeba aestuarina, Strain SoJaBio B1-5/56/2" /LENGTH=395 /DNA_ID=CAMNT_0047913145 /DNA_START=76 /DNA_END=1263 /DNA_ORIENTATION=+
MENSPQSEENVVGGKCVAALVSDHGFGHAARMISILSALLERGAKVVVVSAVPEWFFTQNLKRSSCPMSRFEYIVEKLTVGCYQKSGVEIDVEKTYEEASKFWEKSEEKKQQIASCLKPHSPEVIIFDIPALAPLVAKELNIPSIGISNFGWNWIYESFVPKKPEFQLIVKKITEAYDQTTIALALPFSCEGLSCFSCPRIPVRSLVALKSQADRTATRSRILKDGMKHLMLLSFGAHKFPLSDLEKWKIPDGWGVVLIRNEEMSQSNPRVMSFTNDWLTKEGLVHCDLVAACDVVVVKTGYGIVGEILAHSIPCLFVPRPDFREHPYLAEALQLHTRALPISLEDVMDGGKVLFGNVEKVIEMPEKAPFSTTGMIDIANFVMEYSLTNPLPASI